MKKKFLLILLLSMFLPPLFWRGVGGEAFAQIISPIPSNRVIDWTHNGIPGGIPNRTTVYAAISASTYGNGSQDATAGIQAVLNACPANQVVSLSAGTFRIDTKLTLPDNVTLRGAGPQQTILDGHGNSKAMIYFGQQAGIWNPPLIGITSGLNAGSTSITVADASSI